MKQGEIITHNGATAIVAEVDSDGVAYLNIFTRHGVTLETVRPEEPTIENGGLGEGIVKSAEPIAESAPAEPVKGKKGKK